MMFVAAILAERKRCSDIVAKRVISGHSVVEPLIEKLLGDIREAA